jgi:hypothetical protein
MHPLPCPRITSDRTISDSRHVTSLRVHLCLQALREDERHCHLAAAFHRLVSSITCPKLGSRTARKGRSICDTNCITALPST